MFEASITVPGGEFVVTKGKLGFFPNEGDGYWWMSREDALRAFEPLVDVLRMLSEGVGATQSVPEEACKQEALAPSESVRDPYGICCGDCERCPCD